MNKGFRHPKDMKAKSERTPVSARVPVATKEMLEVAARKHDMTLAELIANILEDYAEWLRSNPSK